MLLLLSFSSASVAHHRDSDDKSQQLVALFCHRLPTCSGALWLDGPSRVDLWLTQAPSLFWDCPFLAFWQTGGSNQVTLANWTGSFY